PWPRRGSPIVAVSTCTASLKHAVQWGIVARNVADMLDAPRVRATEVEVLTPAQVQTVLETLRDKPLYPIVAVLLGTGLRRSEALANGGKDAALDAGTLGAGRALEEPPRGGLTFKAPKPRHGRRTITLPPSTVAVLRDHWKAQQEQRLFLGLGKAPADALVFAAWDGSTRSPNGLTKEWQLAMKKVGFKATFHSLRHTHASPALASGLDVLTSS